MEKYIFGFDIETMKFNLLNFKTNAERLDCLNINIKETERMIEELKSTKVAEGYENGCWSIFTTNEYLSDMVTSAVEFQKEISKTPITDTVLQQKLDGIKNNLTEYLIYVKSEYDFIKRGNENDQEIVEKQKTMQLPPGSTQEQFQNIVKNLQSKINVWYNSDIKIKTKLANEIDFDETDKTTKKKNYTKVALHKKVNIEIAAALRTYPKPPTLTELEKESIRVLTKGKISTTTWWHLHKDIKFWNLVIEEIEDRLKSKRKLKQDTNDNLVSLKDIITAGLAKMEIRKEYEETRSSGDIYEEKNALEYTDENMGYIKTKKDKTLDLGDSIDDQEAAEFDDYGAGAD